MVFLLFAFQGTQTITVAEYLSAKTSGISEGHSTAATMSHIDLEPSSDGGGQRGQHVTFSATTPTKIGSPTVSVSAKTPCIVKLPDGS